MPADTAYPHVFQPIEVAGHRLPNRIVMGSMHTGLEEREDGPERLAAFYAERARHGCGLIVTGGYSVDDAGRLHRGAASFDTPAVAAAHRPVAAAVQAEGGRILLQLLHAGRYGYHDGIVAPSAIRAPINKATPREMTEADIAATIDAFATAAGLAREAGFDGVEIMGSEGYLINEFTAPCTNRRADRWGGSFENRIRFPLAVIEAVRAATAPDFIIMYRLSVLDIVEGGSPLTEVRALAARVEEAGADVVNSGIGWHEARIPTIAQAVPRAGFAWATARVRDALSRAPIVAVNRFNMPETAEAVLAAGEADMISLARPFLADSAFVEKARAGRAEAINTCIACNQACLDHYFTGQVASCLVNPRACHETEIELTPAAGSKSVAVVGAGVAGLACAEALAMRGHAVTLFESQDRIGGQFALAQAVPGKQEFAETLRYFTHRIGELKIDLRLETDAGLPDLQRFEAVVLATGVRPHRPEIPGIDHPSVMSYAEFLSGSRTVGRRVCVIGAGGIGVDVALALAEGEGRAHLDPTVFRRHWGVEAEAVAEPPAHKVTLLRRRPGKMGVGPGKTTGWVHRLALLKAGVEMVADAEYHGIGDDGLTITVRDDRRVIACDSIILCTGQRAVNPLENALRQTGKEIHVIGGAREPGELDAKRAIAEGLAVAQTV